MSSPSINVAPASSQGAAGKKKRPNFRPSQRKQAPKAAAAPQAQPVTTAAAPPDASTTVPVNENFQNAVPEAAAVVNTEKDVNESPLLAAAAVDKTLVAPAAVVATKLPAQSFRAGANTQIKRTRKRKKTGVEIGVSRAVVAQESIVAESTPDAATLLQHTTSTATAAASATDPSAQAPLAAGQNLTALDESQTVPTGPRLNSFCSKFRSSKRKKKEKAPTQDVAAVPGEEETATVSAGPIVQIINGEIVLQESSLVVQGNSKPDEDFIVVEEEAQLAVVGASYNSFVSRRAPQHWSVEETELFYEALRQVGTDFGTMEAYFGKKRTRKQLKRKYQIESTKNPRLIEMALDPSAKKKIDLSVFKVSVDKTKKTTTNAAAAAATNEAPPAAGASNSVESARDPPPPEPASEAAPPEPEVESEPLWPTEEDDVGDPMQLVNDPLLHEEPAEQEQAAPASISLVPKASGKAKSKRPKFRSRRAKK